MTFPSNAVVSCAGSERICQASVYQAEAARLELPFFFKVYFLEQAQ